MRGWETGPANHEEEVMLDKLSDEHIATLLRVAKKSRALRPFFGSPRGMIALREEAARRGVYRTKCEADAVFGAVIEEMKPENSRRA
jgi:hypothetical protein